MFSYPPPVSSDLVQLFLVATTWSFGGILNKIRGGQCEKEDGTTLSIDGLVMYMVVSTAINAGYTAWLKYIHKIRPQDHVYSVRQVKVNEDACGYAHIVHNSFTGFILIISQFSPFLC